MPESGVLEVQPQAGEEAQCLEDGGSWQTRCSTWHHFPRDKAISHQNLVFLSLVITELENSYVEGDI